MFQVSRTCIAPLFLPLSFYLSPLTACTSPIMVGAGDKRAAPGPAPDTRASMRNKTASLKQREISKLGPNFLLKKLYNHNVEATK